MIGMSGPLCLSSPYMQFFLICVCKCLFADGPGTDQTRGQITDFWCPLPGKAPCTCFVLSLFILTVFLLLLFAWVGTTRRLQYL